jgi:hypothetical protein
MNDKASQHCADWMDLKLKGRYYAKVSTSAAHAPEKV